MKKILLTLLITLLSSTIFASEEIKPKKTPFRFPTERYLNVVKHGYKDCKLNIKYLEKALIE